MGQLINLLIFIWLGKIILNFNLFITDPLAVLSYPSNSDAFYLAILLSLITIWIQYKRKKIDPIPFINASIQIFLISSFIYECVQVIWKQNTYSIAYLSLLAMLIISFLVIGKWLSPNWLNLFLVFGWTIGSLSLALIKPIFIVFGYTMAPSVLIFILIACCVMMVYQKRRGGL